VKGIVSADSFKTQDYYSIMTEIMPELESASVDAKLKSSHVPSMETIVMMSDEKRKGTFNFGDIAKAGNADCVSQVELLKKKIQMDDAANIQFTSVTTDYSGDGNRNP